MLTVNHKACPLEMQHPAFQEHVAGQRCFLNTCYLKNKENLLLQMHFKCYLINLQDSFGLLSRGNLR